MDDYAIALHTKRDVIQKSLYQLFELHSSQRQYPELTPEIRNIHKKGQDYLLQAVKLLEQYAEYVPSVGQNYRRNPWYGLKTTQLSYDDRNRLRDDLKQLSDGYKNLQGTTARIKTKYETPELNFAETLRWKSLLAFSAESDVVTPSILSRDTFNRVYPHLLQMQKLSGSLIPIRDRFLDNFQPGAIHEIDGRDIYSRLTGQFGSFFTRLFSGDYKNLVASIQPYVKSGKKLNYREAVAFAAQLMNLQSATNEFAETEAAVSGCLGACYKGPDTDWNHVMTSLDKLKEYLNDETPTFGLLSRMSSTEFAEYQKEFQEDSKTLTDEINAIDSAKKRVMCLFDLETLDLEKHSYTYCVVKLIGCLNGFEKLANWISFMVLLEKLRELELSQFIDLVIAKQIKAEDIVGVYLRAFYKQWIEYIVFSVPVFASFSRIRQDQAVHSFDEKDGIQYSISKAQIKAELSQQRPNLDMIAGGSAVAVLRREGRKKRKQMAVRRLLSEIGDLVQIIKPCFLMSPLSVSTYLDPERIRFDTVIFDEASQIFPQDAIGAIYRADQVIVVGDSKQMPPSDFFNALLDIDEENEEIGDVTDFESILDICSTVFSTKRLAWHYRSHYEQLIAFSNINFYNNHLVTFPSSSKDQKGIGVDYYPVDGVFDRKSKTNRREAEFIVDLIYKNIDKYPDRSLGVVAFSVAQQNLIDKLLSKKREEDPSYEWFFKEDAAEPFFIKNLESVQGDERDTIIFSVAYAKDSTGRFINNFGPLNREGGERRLNVAVTRAKDNVQMVASIHYTDISLSGSEGVRLLRAYLDYAQNGEEALERAVTVPNEDYYDSYFEQEVCDYLRDQGFTVDTQIGCSGFRIDLGVRRPNSSHYVLAVECDGATYHSSKNARDRDILRQRVLENMGWKFYRIWSTDWYRNTSIEKRRLLQAAKEAIENSMSSEELMTTNRRTEPNEKAETVQDRFVSEIRSSTNAFSKYVEIDALQIVKDPKYKNNFQGAVRAILEKEGPISEEYLLKRIVYCFGRSKITKVVIRDFNNILYGCQRKGIIRKNGFLYLQDMNDVKLRVPGDKREIKYISVEELADGILTLIKQNVAVSRESLYKALTNLLGFSRTGEAITSRYDEALNLLRNRNIISEDDGLLAVR